MDENVTRPLPPLRGTPYLLVVLAGAALGPLRTTIALVRQGEGESAGAWAMTGFVVIGPAAVLLYFYLALIGRPVRVGSVISSPGRAAMATVLGVGSYAAPSFLLLDRSLTGAVITAVVVAAMGAAVLGAMRNFFRRATPSSTKGLEQP